MRIISYYVIFGDNYVPTDILLQWFKKEFKHMYKAFKNILYADTIQKFTNFSRHIIKRQETCNCKN